MSRTTDLLAAAADAMDNGQDPFAHWFLDAHDVTLDEVYELGETLALAARIYLELRRRPSELALQIAAVAIRQTAGERGTP